MATAYYLHVVQSLEEYNRLVDGKLITRIDMDQMRRLRTLATTSNPAVSAMLENIDTANFTRGIQIRGRHGSRIGDNMCDPHSWVPAMKRISRLLSAWGVCVVGVNAMKKPIVYEILRDFREFGFFQEAAGGETTYYALVADRAFGATGGLGGMSFVAPTLSGTGRSADPSGAFDMRTFYAGSFVVETSRPDESGVPTVPIASLVAVERFKNLIMGAYAATAVRNCSPPVATEENPVAMRPEDQYGVTDAMVVGDHASVRRDLAADASLNRDMVDRRSAQRAGLSDALLGTSGAGGGMDNHFLGIDQNNGGLEFFRAGPEAYAMANRHIQVPSGRHMTSAPPMAQAPDALEHVMRLVREDASRVLGVPEAVLGGSDNAHATQYAIMNAYYTTLRAHRVVCMSVARLIAWHAFRDEMQTFAMGSGGKRTRDGKGSKKRARNAESGGATARSDRPKRPAPDSGGAVKKEPHGKEEDNGGQDDSDDGGGEEEIDEGEIPIPTDIDIEVILSGDMSSAVTIQLYNNGFMEHKQACRHLCDYYNLPTSSLSSRHIDPGTSMTVEQKLDYDVRCQQQAASAGQGSGGGGGENAVGFGKTFKPPVTTVRVRDFMENEAGVTDANRST